jgi:hypothetical protein
MLRIAELGPAVVERTLAELEAMLDHSDLRPVHVRLHAEQGVAQGGREAGAAYVEPGGGRQAARSLSSKRSIVLQRHHPQRHLCK